MKGSFTGSRCKARRDSKKTVVQDEGLLQWESDATTYHGFKQRI
jgi:hypothetical protein